MGHYIELILSSNIVTYFEIILLYASIISITLTAYRTSMEMAYKFFIIPYRALNFYYSAFDTVIVFLLALYFTA
jgi:hypothetical protein